MTIDSAARSSRSRWLAAVLCVVVLLTLAVLPVRLALVNGSPVVPEPVRALVASEIAHRQAFAEGQITTWSYLFTAQPSLENPRARVFYPPHLLLRLVPAVDLVALSFVLHAWVAGLGGYLLGRGLKLTPLPAFMAGAATMLSIAYVLPNPAALDQLCRTAWLPLIFARAQRAFEGRRIAPDLVLVLLLATTALAGSWRGDVYAIGAVAGVALFEAAVRSEGS